MTENQPQNEGKMRTLFLTEGRTLLAAFLSGTAIILWLYSFIISPQRSQDTDIQLIQKDLVNLRDNHVHTVEVKVDALTEEQKKQALQLERITTILEERLPVKAK